MLLIWKQMGSFFRIPPSPFSQRELHFLPKPLFNGLYTPFGSPVPGGQKPQGREDVTALRCSEPLRYKVGGPKRSSPCYTGWDRLGTASWLGSSFLWCHESFHRSITLFPKFFIQCFHKTSYFLIFSANIRVFFETTKLLGDFFASCWKVPQISDLFFGNMTLSNFVSELSRFPDFQSRWLRWPNSIEFISHFVLFAERITYSCTTVSLQLYNYICYGCTTLELWLYNYKGLSCTTAEFCFLTQPTNLDNMLIFWYLCIFAIFQIFSKKDFLVGNP